MYKTIVAPGLIFLRRHFAFRKDILFANETFGGAKVLIYNSIAIFLNIFVNYFLLLATAEILNINKRYFRFLLAVILLNSYNVFCLLTDFPMPLERAGYIVFVILSAMVAFGFCYAFVRAIVVYLFLNLGLWACVCGFGSAGYWSIVACIISLAAVYFLCCFRYRFDSKFVTVTLRYSGNTKVFNALKDTGNNLRDPLTGRSVLVVGADIAKALFGLTQQQLENPIRTLQSNIFTGLQLLPYSGIGNQSAMLLAIKMKNVRIGTWQGSCLVALAPQNIIGSGNCQALIGEDV